MLSKLLKLRVGLAVALAALVYGSAPASAQESTWDAIQSAGKVRVGVLQGEPYGFKDPATGKWAGMMVSFGQAVAEALKVEPEFVEVGWGTAVSALQANQIDVMPFLNPTPERALVVDYANSALSYDALSLLTHSEEDLSEWEKLDRSGFKVAVQQGSSWDGFLTRTLTKAEIMRFPSYADQLAALQSRTVDAVAMSVTTLVPVVGKLGGKIVVPRPTRYSAADVAMRQEADKRFRDWMTTAARSYYDSGQSQEWYIGYLQGRGIDTVGIPSIQRENW